MLSHTTRILRIILHHHPLPRLTYARAHSSLANRDVLTDDDYVPYAANNSALGLAGWTPPPPPAGQVANEWSLEWGGGLIDGEQHPLEGESVNEDKEVLEDDLTERHTGGGGKLRVGGKRPAVAAKMEKKRLERLKRLEAEEEENKSRQKLIDVSSDASMHKKREYNPLYKKPWDPTFKKASINPHNISVTKKEHKPRPHKGKSQNPDFEKTASDIQDTTDPNPDVPKQRKKKETEPQLDKKAHPPTPKGASPTDPSTDPPGPTYKKTQRGRRRSAVFNRTNSAPQHPQMPQGPRGARVRAEPKPRDPTRKRKKWELPAIETVAVEPTRLQKHIASHPRNQIERWKVEKARLHEKFKGAKWEPKKKLSPEALDGIRFLHAKHPEYTTEKLSQLFEVSPDVIRRILKSKWRPDPATSEDRMARWERRGESVWHRWLDMGVVSTKKMKKKKASRRKWRELKWGVPGETSPGEEKKDNIIKQVRGLSKRIM